MGHTESRPILWLCTVLSLSGWLFRSWQSFYNLIGVDTFWSHALRRSGSLSAFSVFLQCLYLATSQPVVPGWPLHFLFMFILVLGPVTRALVKCPAGSSEWRFLTMWDLRPLAIMENKINIKVSLLWTVLLSPKIYSRGPRTSGTFCACSACWRQASQLALCSPRLLLSMTLPLSLFPNWYLLCFSNTLPRSSCWNVIWVLNCPPTLLLQFKNKKNKQTQP